MKLLRRKYMVGRKEKTRKDKLGNIRGCFVLFCFHKQNIIWNIDMRKMNVRKLEDWCFRYWNECSIALVSE